MIRPERRKMARIIKYNGAEYRVAETSPSQKYILAQKSNYPETGKWGLFMDAPIDLFRITEDRLYLLSL